MAQTSLELLDVVDNNQGNAIMGHWTKMVSLAQCRIGFWVSGHFTHIVVLWLSIMIIYVRCHLIGQ